MAINVPAIDSRCADPAFAEKYPNACLYFTRLILKNEKSFGVGSGAVTVQFKAFAIANGQEVELTAGVVYASSRTSIGTINSSTGLATKVAVGKTTISATWNNQVAYAELEFIATAPVSNYLVLLDNSYSMQQNFDSEYPTKLALGKYLAERFFQSIRSTVDSMAFGNFALGADVNLELSQTIADLRASVLPIQVVHEMTDLRDAINDGVEYLNENATASAVKVLVLLTDGQYNRGDLPGPSAREFKQSGGIIMVVGIRAFGVYFQTLNEIATKGYFLSAFGGNSEAVASNLIGLKAFLGGGDCPGGAVFGCLTSPLAAQIADPDPLQVIPEN